MSLKTISIILISPCSSNNFFVTFSHLSLSLSWDTHFSHSYHWPALLLSLTFYISHQDTFQHTIDLFLQLLHQFYLCYSTRTQSSQPCSWDAATARDACLRFLLLSVPSIAEWMCTWTALSQRISRFYRSQIGLSRRSSTRIDCGKAAARYVHLSST